MQRLALALIAAAASTLTAWPAGATESPSWALVPDAKGGVWLGEQDSGGASDGLGCDAGAKGKVHLVFYLEHPPQHRSRPPWPTPLTVTSGAVSAIYPATMSSNDNDNGGGGDVWTDIPATAPVMVEFAGSGRILFAAEGETSEDRPVPVELAARLVKVCGG